MRAPASTFLLGALCAPGPAQPEAGAAVFLGSGLRVGEVDATSVQLWTRVTARSGPLLAGPEFLVPEGSGRAPLRPAQLPVGAELEAMRGALPGAAGEVAFRWRAEGEPDWHEEPWQSAGAGHDFVVQHRIEGLLPGQHYEFEARLRAADAVARARVRTAPAADAVAGVRFALLTCQDAHRTDAPDGFQVLAAVRALAPDFVVHAGDFVYYDRAQPFATDVGLARFHWHRMLGKPSWRALAGVTSFYHQKDDHDLLKNDCWPGQRYGALTFADGQRIFRAQTPLGDGPAYRTRRWGRDLQVWLAEGRDHRSPNRMPDGPGKTIWGAEQMAWFRASVAASDAAFKLLLSPTPVVGPDRESKNDNHANRGFAHEGAALRAFLAEHGVLVLCGDRHWQYESADPATGVREWSAGPATDVHAGGFRQGQRRDAHRYLRVRGGFLEVELEHVEDAPRLHLRHRDVAGAVQHAVTLDRG